MTDGAGLSIATVGAAGRAIAWIQGVGARLFANKGFDPFIFISVKFGLVQLISICLSTFRPQGTLSVDYGIPEYPCGHEQ